MDSSGYRVRKVPHGHSSSHRSAESASSSSPDAYQESNTYHYQQYNDAFNTNRFHNPRPSHTNRRLVIPPPEAITRGPSPRRVAPSPPLRRRITTPSPPPCKRRIAPPPPSPTSYPNNSTRLKDYSIAEFNQPQIKHRIAPPPPESFMNAEGHSTSSKDYSRSYYESPSPDFDLN